jgi:GNAT superfamily N-acetyltransferase
MAEAFEVTAAGPEHADGLAALFRAAGSPCFCRFWHFTGSNNEWLARCASGDGENARGVVALVRGTAEVVGWAKVAPASVLRKAYSRRLYKGLPCFEGDREGVFAIACLLVHPGQRKRGVSEALVRGAVAIAPSWGARALEAFPRRPKEPVNDDELWTGPMSPFEKNGFVEVHAFEPYPVLRRVL